MTWGVIEPSSQLRPDVGSWLVLRSLAPARRVPSRLKDPLIIPLPED
jgi:hypothetical protein